MNSQLADELGERVCDILRIPHGAEHKRANIKAMKKVLKVALPGLLAGQCVSITCRPNEKGPGHHTLDISIVRTKENHEQN